MTDSDEDDFHAHFHEWMSACLKYEQYRLKGLEIPEDVDNALKKSLEWIENLSDEEYSRLIH